MPPTPDTLSLIAKAATDLGFVGVGFTPIPTLARGTRALADWLHQGYHGEMGYMAAHGLRDDPARILEQARGILVVALPYQRELPVVPTPLQGSVARYARGPDYHGVLKQKLFALADQLAQILEGPVLARPCVDTAPLLEREVAVEAGLGFIAKSTMTILPGFGTYTLLGELLIDVELPQSTPADSKCGDCVACLQACPTQAFVQPWVLDARRCISYLTIESKEAIPTDLRPAIGNRIFGCDICQEVCPFNASPKPRPGSPELSPFPHLDAPDLASLLNLRSGEYRRFVKHTALRRTSRAQLGRNAAVALGNSGDERAVPPLVEALLNHLSPLVRGHAAWALGQFDTNEAKEALNKALLSDSDPSVQAEIRGVLAPK